MPGCWEHRCRQSVDKPPETLCRREAELSPGPQLPPAGPLADLSSPRANQHGIGQLSQELSEDP